MKKFEPRSCAKCRKPFTPRGPAGKYCDACGARGGKKKADVTRPTRGQRARKKPSPSMTDVSSSIAARIRDLVLAVETGKRAAAELEAIREALA